jgi:hypothetical protein
MRRLASIILALTCVNAIITSASAQALAQLFGVRLCQSLKDDAQRLKCFDELFAEKPNERQQQSSKDRPDVETIWNVDESKSPVDDTPQVMGMLRPVSGEDRAALVLRCKEKKTEAIFAGPFLGTTSQIKVLVRIADGKPIETMWSPSQSGTGAFAPNAIQFIRALPDNGKLFIRAFGYGGKTADGEFRLGNVSEVREKIAEACSWPAANAKQPQAPKRTPTANAQ